MKTILKLAAILAVGSLMPIAAHATSFSECPNVGLDTAGCQITITVTSVSGGVATGFFTTDNPSPNSSGPFDGVEDTLVGVINSSGAVLNSISISGSGVQIFGFDNDGACSGAYSPGPTLAQCGLASFTTTDPADYESAGVTFSGIDLSTLTTGTVNFTGGLANNGTAWFSLEDPIKASQIVSTTPEPSSLILLGTGALGLAGSFRRRILNVVR